MTIKISHQPDDFPRRVSDVEIRGKDVVFLAEGVESPEDWSENAVRPPAQLYFRTRDGVRERSIFGMVDRVVGAIETEAVNPSFGFPLVDPGAPLVSPEEAREDAPKPPSKRRRKYGPTDFGSEVRRLVLDQRMAFNTPVWINAGAPLPPGEKPQCSACFILSVSDDLEDIARLQTSEILLFRRGSGTGTNLSSLRPRGSKLSRGGTASGPVSFAVGYDAWAAVTKSGGSSRRAAKMVVLDVGHPDVYDFVDSKVLAEKMKRTLVAGGWDSDYNAPATAWGRFQNANHSIRATDEYMRAVEADASYDLRYGDEKAKTIDARDLWRRVGEAAFECGDPGVQFATTINSWHTCPNSGEIRASNPCSEYLFLDDSACNLASIRLTKYWLPGRSRRSALGTSWKERSRFDAETFATDARTTTVALEAIVGLSGYPTEKVAKNSFDFRTLGLGYADLGGLLLRAGLAYDSKEGRAAAAAVTSLLGGVAYRTSAEIARDCGGPFPRYAENRDPMLRVIRRHAEAARALLDDPSTPEGFREAARLGAEAWAEALSIGEEFGFRNAQATLLAPTGTIGIMMDCDTTGCEPYMALATEKLLAGGGTMRFEARGVADALVELGYAEAEAASILAYIRENGFASGAPGLRREDVAVFRTSLLAPGASLADDVITAEGHVDMMAAVQPFLSGAISKTVNAPASYTAEDILRIYERAWRSGVKAVAVYRDGSKGSQPMKAVGKETPVASAPPVLAWGARKRLPSERPAVTRKFEIAGHDFYVHVGLRADGAVGEIFFRAAKEGSLVQALLSQLGTAWSLALQHGASVSTLVDKMIGTSFEPSGFTGDPEFPAASSFLDAAAKWLRKRYVEGEGKGDAADLVATPVGSPPRPERFADRLSGKLCRNGCGPMFQDGTCWRCPTCLDSSGGCGS